MNAGLEREACAALARLDRRGFLRLAAALAATGLAPVGCGGGAWTPPSGVTLKVLTPRACATFEAAAMRLVGPRGAAAIAARELAPAVAADAWLTRSPALAGPFAQALWVLEWGVWPLVAKGRPFTALSGASQDAVLDELMRSRLDLKRDLFQGIRSLSMLTVYAEPGARPLVGDPGPFDRAGIRAALAD